MADQNGLIFFRIEFKIAKVNQYYFNLFLKFLF